MDQHLLHYVLTCTQRFLPVWGTRRRYPAPTHSQLQAHAVSSQHQLLPLCMEIITVCMQVAIAKHGLQTLLTTNYYFTEVLSQGVALDPASEQKLVWLCGGILSNIALHPNNRSAPPSCAWPGKPSAVEPLCIVILQHGMSAEILCMGLSPNHTWEEHAH